jgi:hypothetical protein
LCDVDFHARTGGASPLRDTMLLTDDFGKTIQHCQSAAIKDHMTTVNCQNAKIELVTTGFYSEEKIRGFISASLVFW